MQQEYLDLLFLHPPAILGDSHSVLGADVAYSYQFVSFPMGFFSMSHNLESAGYKVRIINLGERMLVKKSGETLEDLVKSIFNQFAPRIIGVDIHWWVHSAGAVETARLIKKVRPETIVLAGGMTATLYADEMLMKYPQIDYIMQGECEDTIVEFVKELGGGNPNLMGIPNLVYRKDAAIAENPVMLPDLGKGIDITRYDLLVDESIVNPDRALIPIERGCPQRCCYCGAAKDSFEHIMKRNKMSIVGPKNVVEMIKKNKEKGRDKIYIYGDIRDGGSSYVKTFFKYLNESQVTSAHIVIELFYPPAEEYVRTWKEWADRTGNTLEATFSPESANERVRLEVGKKYTNKVMLDSCELVMSYGIPLSVYFMFGFPGETNETVEETLRFAEKIVKTFSRKFKKEDLRHEIVGYEFMQLPDPGSIAYMHPEKFGYQLHFDNFEGLVNAVMEARHWSELVGYSTVNFTKDKLAEKYCYIKESVYRLYYKHGLISSKQLGERLATLENDKMFIVNKKAAGSR